MQNRTTGLAGIRPTRFVPSPQSGEDALEDSYLGQFIPLHYHHHMLMDEARMTGFKSAIDYAVRPGARVLELGGGTGVMSCFAAQKASRVWCVEMNPDLVHEARRLVSLNGMADKVNVIHGDAFEYLPPEPVDVVICEMIHTAMLREKQVEVLEAFKRRYVRRFGLPLPRFLPEAAIMAVQPLQQGYEFFGFHAPIMQFQKPQMLQPQSVEMAAPKVYSVLDYGQSCGKEVRWEGEMVMERDGTVNALRFVTKNVLAIVQERGTTIDWLNDYLVLPLEEPVTVRAGEALRIEFSYRFGGSLRSLQQGIRAWVASAVRAAAAGR